MREFKTSEEMAESIFKRRDLYKIEQKKKKEKLLKQGIGAVTSCFAFVLCFTLMTPINEKVEEKAGENLDNVKEDIINIKEEIKKLKEDSKKLKGVKSISQINEGQIEIRIEENSDIGGIKEFFEEREIEGIEYVYIIGGK